MELIVGQVYRRTSLHDYFSGQQQGGISTPTEHPVILIFTGASGEQYGYSDGFQPDGTFWYTGEGQIGDMTFRGGNRAIRDAGENGKTIHLFEEAQRSHVQYLGQATYLGYHTSRAPDKDGNDRQVIVFELALDDGDASGAAPDLRNPAAKDGGAELRKKSLAELRALALARVPKDAPPKERKVNVQTRSAAVRAYVLARAKGMCEGCNNAAPFKRKDGSSYLEPHHIRRRADAGPDHPRWVTALCPNCHRRVHHAHDGNQFNKALEDRVGALEA
jgi:5-methylcytosine-specific restriction protein A